MSYFQKIVQEFLYCRGLIEDAFLFRLIPDMVTDEKPRESYKPGVLLCIAFYIRYFSSDCITDQYGRVDRASATKTVDLALIPGRVKPRTKNWYSQLPCLTFSN